ncbi:MAG: sporulation transcriptional regulator SpoIIID, partial [Clostridia bacterium]|nr:sporulation transcriptional regulator SpoIIID [Clostridia bacterium]
MVGVSIEERAINLAQYIINSKDTVRGAAKKFGISKSTVHKDLTDRLIK